MEAMNDELGMMNDELGRRSDVGDGLCWNSTGEGRAGKAFRGTHSVPYVRWRQFQCARA
jgi:hypothetical protein